MRTTLDLPDDLLKRVKIAAVERDSTLRDFVADALRHELGQPSRTRPKRLTKPPIRLAPDSPLRSLRSAEIQTIEEEGEAEALRAVYRGR